MHNPLPPVLLDQEPLVWQHTKVPVLTLVVEARMEAGKLWEVEKLGILV
jgi:hypothetical protein